MRYVLLLVNSLTLREVNTVAVTLATQTLSDRKQWKHVWKEIQQESSTGPVDVVCGSTRGKCRAINKKK